MNRREVAGVIILLTLAFGFIGWVLNIIAIFNSGYLPTGELILRVVGIFIAPLGAIMGLFV
jgi:hypothetical protein